MPSSVEHRAKADRNRKFLDSIRGGSHSEWVAVVAFYTAVHLVERLSACESLHNDKHHDRLAYLSKHKKHRGIYAPFSTLFDASLISRYGTANQFDKAFPGDTVEKDLIGKCLVKIEGHVAAHFAPPPAPTGP